MDGVAAQISTQLPTGVLNRTLIQAYERVAPPYVKGKRLKIFYATQVGVKPITILLFVNDSTKLIPAYEAYLMGVLRKTFGLEGAPIVFKLKQRVARSGIPAHKTINHSAGPTQPWRRREQGTTRQGRVRLRRK
jgi:GTP-binding protein